jgi:ribosomal protein S18 acetylase RimI-like enzyme/predicted double-glycine peptidase
MPSRARIRLATEYDLPGLVHLEEVAFDSDRFTKDQIDYLLTRSRATTFVLEQGSAMAGAACVLWRKSRQLARLYNIAVDPAFRGLGYGDKLLNECEVEAIRRECDRITLEVRQDNEGAIRFYEKHGYTAIRNLPDYYSDGMAGLKMGKQLRRKVNPRLRLNIPYHAQSLDFTCGPACVMMTLRYFFPKLEIGRALEMTLWKEATMIFMASGFGGTDAYGLALAAVNRGLNCRVIMSMESTPMLKSVRIPSKREVMKIVHNDMKRKARRAGVTNQIYEYGIDEIISAMYRGMVPIAMISTYRLTGDRVPHWVIVTGFDKDNVYIHDPDIDSYRRNKSRARNLKIEKSEFLQMTRYGKEVYRCLLLVGKPPGISKIKEKPVEIPK